MLARQNFSNVSEEAINGQITLEYKASYTYTSLAAYFDRDNVALPGFARFFRKSAEEEREHAQKLIDYVNKRGGRVSFANVEAPQADWKSARFAVEFTLELEREVNLALLKLRSVAEEQNDPHLSDYIESEFLTEQVEAIKFLADLLTNLNRVGGDGVGLYLIDQQLRNEGPKK